MKMQGRSSMVCISFYCCAQVGVNAWSSDYGTPCVAGYGWEAGAKPLLNLAPHAHLTEPAQRQLCEAVTAHVSPLPYVTCTCFHDHSHSLPKPAPLACCSGKDKPLGSCCFTVTRSQMAIEQALLLRLVVSTSCGTCTHNLQYVGS